jgi:hypothetical protein
MQHAPAAPETPGAFQAEPPAEREMSQGVTVEARPPAISAGHAHPAAVPAQAVPAPAVAARPAPAQGIAPVQPFAPRPETDGSDPRPSCTVAQLRRFIKSRPWIPMHELRRRFGIYGGDDDVSTIRVGEHTLFVGLPTAEARLMAELLGGGDVGFELSLDPVTPIVVGVYPMRPVPRG